MKFQDYADFHILREPTRQQLRDIGDVAGVYALLDKRDGVLYVGQSRFLGNRLMSHKSGFPGPLVHIAYRLCDAKCLDDSEMGLLWKYLPYYCGQAYLPNQHFLPANQFCTKAKEVIFRDGGATTIFVRRYGETHLTTEQLIYSALGRERLIRPHNSHTGKRLLVDRAGAEKWLQDLRDEGSKIVSRGPVEWQRAVILYLPYEYSVVNEAAGGALDTYIIDYLNDQTIIVNESAIKHIVATLRICGFCVDQD